MGRLFGTDGVRGLANADLTPELTLALSVSAAHVVAEADRGHRPVAVVGRDTRASGELLEAAVVAGLASAGADVVRVGVLPTPGVAFLTGALGADIGVMLSASHNPMPDNGIKFFAAGGHKLADPVEDAIEARLAEEWKRPTGAGVGRVRDLADATDRYAAHLMSALPHRLDGLRVVVDCAHGAASTVAPQVLRAAGAEVHVIGAEPDGLNINDGCGSTHLDVLQKAVLDLGADAGIAHDGDADRCLAVDAHGEVVDGDQVLAVCALAMGADRVAATVMSNLGFKKAMAAAGIDVVETAVGDRYVLEAMHRDGIRIGGEQSGHTIFLDWATTGDGVLTALRLLGQVAATGRSLAELAGVMTRYPQVLLNVRVADKAAAMSSPALAAATSDAERDLAGDGRVLVRPSGTESLVRVMVEAASHDVAQSVAERVAATIR